MKRKTLFIGLVLISQTFSFGNYICAQPIDAAPPGTARFDPKNPATVTIVKPQESLYDIAERTRSPLIGIIEANNLLPPYILYAGQAIKLPPLKVHIVQKGEQFEDIAKRYSIDMRSLAVFNNMQRPYNIKKGQKIIMPAMVQDSFTGKEAIDLVSVISGEINNGKIVSGNNGGVISVRRDNTIPTLPKSFSEAADVGTPKPNIIPPKPTLPNKEVSPVVKSNIIPVVNGRFSWPLRGNIIEAYGEKQNFVKNDGIDISASLNTPFKAAADGEVAFVSDKVTGYGWLVLIKHKDGFLTAYAYANKILVKEGDIVKKGQDIGMVGQTGRATSPRLHFQIRNGAMAIDPTPHLARG